MSLLKQVSLLAGCLLASGTVARERMVEGFPDLPRDARMVAERSLACLHFGGEFSGEPERDKWLMQQMRKLRCDRVERDLAAVKHKYRAQPALLKILSEASYE